MKRLGFLTGAVLAGIGVFMFNHWRHVSDDDRLLALLGDHCLPYVQRGEIPFQTLGRAPGVYDVVGRDNTLAETGSRIIYDLRFVAQWGVSTGFEHPVRVCKVSPTYSENTVPTFQTNTDDFNHRFAALLPTLQTLSAQNFAIGGGQMALGWLTPDGGETDDLQVSVLASEGQVSNVVVTARIPRE